IHLYTYIPIHLYTTTPHFPLRNANRSAISPGLTCAAMPSGIMDIFNALSDRMSAQLMVFSNEPALRMVMAAGVSLAITPTNVSPLCNSTDQLSKPLEIDRFGARVLSMIASIDQLWTVPRSGPSAVPRSPRTW